MKPIAELIRQGGPVMWPILALSVILYARCFQLLRYVLQARRQRPTSSPAAAHTYALAVMESYERQKFPISAMIAAAPLLGLLGTVAGMIGTFEHLATWNGLKSMEGLARGISEVLICTESGLAVAIPAVLLLYFIHRQAQKVHPLRTPPAPTPS